MGAKGYFSHVRHDLIRQVPKDSRRVLEVGCGIGVTGAELKRIRDNNVEVVGLEYSEGAGKQAQERLDKVFIGNAETLDLPFDEGYFDCILYGDVLEHLVNPWALIKKHRRYLNDEGCMVASIPNIGYFKMVRMLRRGRWKYEDAGIMDRTHLRFFTRPSVLELFEQAQMSVAVVDSVKGGTLLDNFFRRVFPWRHRDDCIQQFIVSATKRDG